jgi:hypothetical protein
MTMGKHKLPSWRDGLCVMGTESHESDKAAVDPHVNHILYLEYALGFFTNTQVCEKKDKRLWIK